jgi:putative ABC transport system permease protein
VRAGSGPQRAPVGRGAATASRRVLRTAALSLRLLAAHKVRTALSVAGLVVGVAAVMVMVAFGRGAEARILERIHAMGTDLVVVSAAPAPRIPGRPRQAPTVTLLRPDDALAIVRESAHARRAAPAATRSVRVRWEDRVVPTTLTGMTPEGLAILNVVAASGRTFDGDDERDLRAVALLGPTAARSLFGGADPVGRDIRIGRTPFEVIGVTAPRGPDFAGGDQDDVILVPLATALRRVLNIPYVHTILVQATRADALLPLEADVRAALDALHPPRIGAAEAFRIQNQARLLRVEREAARSLTRLVLGVGVLAFLVGGIGILSVMLISVRERMREVGLRRALGARKRDVLVQFVLESSLLAALGGGAGVALGTLVAMGAALFGPWDLRVSWTVALAAAASSAAVGLVAGSVPAWRASRLSPVETLRGGRG